MTSAHHLVFPPPTGEQGRERESIGKDTSHYLGAVDSFGAGIFSPAIKVIPLPKAFPVPDNDIYYLQVPADDDLQDALRGHAAFNHMLLGDVLVEAVEEFIKHWHLLHSKNQRVPYLAHQRGSRVLNIKLPKKLGSRAQALAEKDGTAMRRFAYTALLHFAVNHNLIPPVGTVQSGVPSDHQGPSTLEIARGQKKTDKKQKP